jgi:phosphopantothenoylcysteine decarboxylase/phosphopantothenate--cysteine ligase
MTSPKCVFGVTGGIAAAKASLAASMLVKAGVDVHVIMTKSACEFVTPLTYRTITANPVTVDMFAEPDEWNVKHVSLAQSSDVFVIAPATANLIGKVASGIADDMLTTTIMATRAPVIIVPAMNTGMYTNPIVQRNIATLTDLGYRFVGPECGRLACGDTGPGRMAEPERIVEYVLHVLEAHGRADLAGLKVVVNAGPTREAIDPIRFISNRSSGKMGYAVAGAAAARGARVTLVSGPVSLPRPEGCEVIAVESAGQMLEATVAAAADADIVVATAAVADYTPAHYSESKLKKGDGELSLELARTADILARLGADRTSGPRVLVGFAAETDDLLANAQAKLARKNLDMIAANRIGGDDSPFGSDSNSVVILRPGHDPEPIGPASKLHIAHAILDRATSVLVD